MNLNEMYFPKGISSTTKQILHQENRNATRNTQIYDKCTPHSGHILIAFRTAQSLETPQKNLSCHVNEFKWFCLKVCFSTDDKADSRSEANITTLKT